MKDATTTKFAQVVAISNDLHFYLVDNSTKLVNSHGLARSENQKRPVSCVEILYMPIYRHQNRRQPTNTDKNNKIDLQQIPPT